MQPSRKPKTSAARCARSPGNTSTVSHSPKAVALLRKFAYTSAPAAQESGVTELQKFANDTSNDILELDHVVGDVAAYAADETSPTDGGISAIASRTCARCV